MSASPSTAEPGPTLLERAVDCAAQWVLDGRRLDMQGMAAHLGVSRVTLFRHVGGREALLGDALWLLTERTWELALSRAREDRRPGGLVTPGAMRNLNQLVYRSEGLRKLLDDEPVLTIRVLTDPRGRVQTNIRNAIAQVLRQDQDELEFEPLIDADALAFALVRLGEAFLYADVLASRTPDLAAADRLQSALIEGSRT
ncbi:MAG: hypothetical protein JWN57_174 [Frankiales bacterium]|nr:hypothetical protein [Frankiales bacterium]